MSPTRTVPWSSVRAIPLFHAMKQVRSTSVQGPGARSFKRAQSKPQAQTSSTPPLAEKSIPRPSIHRLISRSDAVMFVGLASVGAGQFGFTEALRIYGPQPLLGERGVIELTQLGLLVSALCVLSKRACHQSLRVVVTPPCCCLEP